jgi:glycosyltransferase involved in cell wall biosynthesis
MIRATGAVDADRLVVLPFGVSLPPRPRERPRRRPTIAFVGHSMERKGGNQLLRLHQQHLRDDCDLVLVTTEDVAPAPGVRVVRDLRSGDGRLWDVLADADLFCFPSTMDQAPNAVLEAAAAGLPVIAHPVAAVPEMVVDGVTGLLVPPADDDALLSALRTLVHDRGRRRAMGRLARAHMELRYDMRRTVDALVDVLDEVSSAPDSRSLR